MKNMLSKIAFIGSSVLLLIAGLLFLVIDGRILFSGDWLVYSDSVFGLFQLIFREIIWITLMAGLPLTAVYLKKNTVELRMAGMVYAIFIFIMGVVAALIFKVDAGKPNFYYMLPAAILPALYILSFYFFESSNQHGDNEQH